MCFESRKSWFRHGYHRGVVGGVYLDGHGWALVADDAIPNASIADPHTMSVTKNGMHVSITVDGTTVTKDFSSYTNGTNLLTAPDWVGVATLGYTTDFSDFTQTSTNQTTVVDPVFQGAWDENPDVPDGFTASDDCVIVFGTVSAPTNTTVVGYGIKVVSADLEEKFFPADTVNHPCGTDGKFGIALYDVPSGTYTAYTYVLVSTHPFFSSVPSVRVFSSDVSFTVV